MSSPFNERELSTENWNAIGYVLEWSVGVMDGTTVLARRTLGRCSERLLDDAEYLEAAARFLRRTEAVLIETQS
jgi:hypothetical protein